MLLKPKIWLSFPEHFIPPILSFSNTAPHPNKDIHIYVYNKFSETLKPFDMPQSSNKQKKYSSALLCNVIYINGTLSFIQKYLFLFVEVSVFYYLRDM